MNSPTTVLLITMHIYNGHNLSIYRNATYSRCALIFIFIKTFYYLNIIFISNILTLIINWYAISPFIFICTQLSMLLNILFSCKYKFGWFLVNKEKKNTKNKSHLFFLTVFLNKTQLMMTPDSNDRQRSSFIKLK